LIKTKQKNIIKGTDDKKLKTDIKKICKEKGGGELSERDNNIRPRPKINTIFVDLKNLEEAKKVVKNINNATCNISCKETTLIVELGNSETFKIKESKNYDSQSYDSQSKVEYYSLQDFYKDRDYESVTKLVNSFIFLLCNYLSYEKSETDQKESE